MKIKMLEHYQDKNIHLALGQEVEVEANLGAWLVEYNKAVALPDARHLDAEPQFEQAEEPPKQAETFGAPKKRGGRHAEKKD